MPEIDTDLYQLLTLVLLLVIAVGVLVAVTSLAGIRKALETSAREQEALPPAAETVEPEQRPEPAPEAAVGGFTAGTQQQPSPALGVEPSRGERPAAAQPQYGAPAAQPGQAEPYGAPATQDPAPAAQEPAPEPAPAQAEPTTTPQEPVVEEPRDQPFERDGRWWFRRGDELLVYDEGTGQWLQAPQQAAPAASGEAAQGGFWKCPSCGAVNGSTAAACRMCFTPRP